MVAVGSAVGAKVERGFTQPSRSSLSPEVKTDVYAKVFFPPNNLVISSDNSDGKYDAPCRGRVSFIVIIHERGESVFDTSQVFKEIGWLFCRVGSS